MALIPTTTITVVRSSNTADPYEAAATSTPYSGVAAHISAVSGSDAAVGGDQESITAEGYCAPAVALRRADLVVDDLTATTYAVVWARRRTGLGLDHLHFGLRATEGGSNG